jgi:hypothetical protein
MISVVIDDLPALLGVAFVLISGRSTGGSKPASFPASSGFIVGDFALHVCPNTVPVSLACVHVVNRRCGP